MMSTVEYVEPDLHKYTAGVYTYIYVVRYEEMLYCGSQNMAECAKDTMHDNYNTTLMTYNL
jgi:hypothetical protein